LRDSLRAKGERGAGTRLGRAIADRKQIARDSYAAFAAGNRQFFEERLSDGFLFSAPPDPELDRDGYFERCWPGAGRRQDFELVRMIEAGDEVVVTYETDTAGGGGAGTPRFSPSTTRTRSPVSRSTSAGTSSSRRCSWRIGVVSGGDSVEARPHGKRRF
jgi:hypothetical protein